MDFTFDEQRRLLNFLGCGRLDAPFWFLGMEEGVNAFEKHDVPDTIRIRARHFEPVMDLAEAYDLFD